MYSGINIESSATCNLRCRVCPTATSPNHTRNGYLNLKTFELIAPSLSNLTEGVDLTGWGEPLLNPYLPTLLEAIPGATFTTNGHLLDMRWAQRIVKLKVGAVAFSIDAATEETYALQHGRGDSAVVWKNAATLRKERDLNKGKTPFISLHFLTMKSNLTELPRFVERAAESGADEVVAKHIALFARPGHEREALFSGYFDNHRPDEKHRDEVFEIAREKARASGIAFRFVGSNVAKPVAGCFGGALTRPFITMDGYVAPCCVLAHETPRLTPSATPYPSKTLFFGNIRENSLAEIWDSLEYKTLRDAIQSGSAPPPCKYCLGSYSVTVGDQSGR